MYNLAEWILDSGALGHFCANKELMINFEEVADGQCVCMGNSFTVAIKVKGKVLLKFTFGKLLSLSNVLFVPFLHRNLVSSALLDIGGLKIVQEVGKVVIMQNGDLVGKGYRSGGLLALNVAAQVNNETAANSVYIIESVDLWHGRLGHVNFASLKGLETCD